MGKWAGKVGILLPTTLNSQTSCIYWCINLKLAKILENGVFKSCKSFVRKVVNLNF